MEIYFLDIKMKRQSMFIKVYNACRRPVEWFNWKWTTLASNFKEMKKSDSGLIGSLPGWIFHRQGRFDLRRQGGASATAEPKEEEVTFYLATVPR